MEKDIYIYIYIYQNKSMFELVGPSGTQCYIHNLILGASIFVLMCIDPLILDALMFVYCVYTYYNTPCVDFSKRNN